MRMYCANCGVQLGDTEEKCPLCGVKAYHPDLERAAAEPLYPRYRYPARPEQKKTALIILTGLYLLPLLICWLCDRQINGSVTWSGYVAGALGLSYGAMVLPYWFRKPNVLVLIPAFFAGVGLYLGYIERQTGGQWFATLGLPVTAYLAGLITALAALLKFCKRGRFFIFGGFFGALGLFTVLVEKWICSSFSLKFLGWSWYPLAVLAVLGGVLVCLGFSKSARETMERKFFI